MNPNTCGCCSLPPSTPLSVHNRPGLSAIAFRAGTYSTFRLTMLQEIARMGTLSSLRTRSDDDYAITLLYMWATIADILTFYQERIANEGFLRTARLRDSVLRMARLLDYQLRPGVAATTLLAFTLDKDAALDLPIGLRVQSVPKDSEQPQIFETLEAMSADSRLNRLRILPAPIGVNPLAPGRVSAILAPALDGLAAAAGLSPNTRFLVFSPSEIEELIVRSLRVDEDRLILTWTGSVQRTNWNIQSTAFVTARSFRVFGYNTPDHYMEAEENPAGSSNFIWHFRSLSTNYGYNASGGVIELDAKYEGIAAGTQLLISEPGANTLVTVTAVSQGQAAFRYLGAPASATTPFQDTVTRITVSPAPAITDRRLAVIHELKGSPIRFWGYRLGDAVSEATIYVPGRRVDAQTVEVGRTIQNNAFTAGSRLSLPSIHVGRRVLLQDATQGPIAATVTGSSIVGVDVDIQATPDDPTTAFELGLASDVSQSIAGLVSAPAPNFFSFTAGAPEISVTVGSLPARTVALGGSSPIASSTVAFNLQLHLRNSLPSVPEFADSKVILIGGRLLVLAGVPDADLQIAPTLNDPTTALELGFSASDSRRVVGLLSAELSPPIVLSNPLREFSVAFGPVGRFVVNVSASPSSIAAAGALLRAALRVLDLGPAFSTVRVVTLPTRLLILPGLLGFDVQDYLAIRLRPDTSYSLDPASAVLLGNIAQASHGESVKDETLGDGDLASIFQEFELQKKPLTYVPSAGPSGVQSTLRVFVSNVLWSEASTLFGQPPTAQVYTSRLADDGTVSVRFGDGVNGSRLPTGRGNVVADYRKGSGLAGRVTALSLRSPLDLPVGLKSVTNPAGATGGADPEALEQARENAPTTVRTFGRAVSIQDFEDIVRSSGEVAKALATWVWNGETRVIHMTVAAQEGGLFTESDLSRIHASLNTERDPNHTLLLDNFIQVPIVIRATVRVNGAYIARKVAEDARAKLLDALSFDTLNFGAPVALSEIYRVLQEVSGVDSVDIDEFQFKDQTAAFLIDRGATADPIQRTLRIFSARPNPVPPPPAVLPAELAFVETPAEDIVILTSGGLPE